MNPNRLIYAKVSKELEEKIEEGLRNMQCSEQEKTFFRIGAFLFDKWIKKQDKKTLKNLLPYEIYEKFRKEMDSYRGKVDDLILNYFDEIKAD